MCLAVIPKDKLRRDTNNSASVEECVGLNERGVGFFCCFLKICMDSPPSFRTMDRTTDERGF